MGSGASSGNISKVAAYHFEMSDIVGRGHASKIFRATLLEPGRLAMDQETPIPDIVAIKVIDTTSHKRYNAGEVLEEYEVLKMLNQESAVKLYEHITVGKLQYLVMEYIEGGDLYNKVTEQGPISEPNAAVIIAQLASLVAEMSANRLVYRDVSAENILLTKSDSNQIRVINFGMTAKEHDRDFSDDMLSVVCGTPEYIAPEVMMQAYDSKADVWSMGVFLYFILSGQYPFRVEDMYSRCHSLSAGSSVVLFKSKYFKNISTPAKRLIKKMLTEDPSERIRATDILRDPWVVEYNLGSLGSLDRCSMASTDPETSEWIQSSLCSGSISMFATEQESISVK